MFNLDGEEGGCGEHCGTGLQKRTLGWHRKLSKQAPALRVISKLPLPLTICPKVDQPGLGGQAGATAETVLAGTHWRTVEVVVVVEVVASTSHLGVMKK